MPNQCNFPAGRVASSLLLLCSLAQAQAFGGELHLPRGILARRG